MSKKEKKDLSEPFAIERSLFYKELIKERQEILAHKWLQSEKMGYDIGFERALLDWICNYRDDWRSWHKRRDNKTKDC